MVVDRFGDFLYVEMSGQDDMTYMGTVLFWNELICRFTAVTKWLIEKENILVMDM